MKALLGGLGVSLFFLSFFYSSNHVNAANPVTRGGSTTINWSVSGATSCTGSAGTYPATSDGIRTFWNSSHPSSGAQAFSGVTGNAALSFPQTYTFTCTDPVSSAVGTATLTVNDCGSGTTWNGTVCASPSVPSVPTGFTATTGGTCGGNITLNWTASSGATSYDVSRDGGAWNSIGNVTTWTDTGLSAGSNHSYQVRAVNANGSSAATASASANASAACVSAPSTPTGLTVTPSTCGNNWLNLGWNATANSTGYKVERDGSGSWIDVGNVTSWSDTGLTLGSGHSYKVLAYNASGSSAATGSVSNTVANACVAAPATPAGFTVTPSSCGNNWLNLGWSASSGATGYKVERDGSGSWIDVGNVTGWSDTGLVLGSTHSYKVLAYNSVGSSAATVSKSGTVAGTCSAAGTITPNSCIIASGASSCSMNIAWTSSATIGTVTVQRAYSPFGTVASGPSGSQSFAFTPPGTYPFNLYDGATLLNTANFTASCAAGTSWSGGICTSSGGGSSFTAVTGACAATGNINLSWPAQGGVTNYQLSRDGGAWFSVGNVTNYTDTGLASGSSHTYRLQTATSQTILSSGTTWVVPSDWNSSSNSIETVGAGGGTNFSYGGGGGGGYSKITNLTLTPGASVTYKIGAGSNAVNGGDTYFCNSTSNCASLAGTAVKVGAQGGRTNSAGTGGAGGAAISGVGTTKFSGGAGNSGSQSGCCAIAGGGGGGAAGPSGTGGSGGAGYVDSDTNDVWSGGGGGYNGGSAGQGGSGVAVGVNPAGGSPNGSGGSWWNSGTSGGGAGGGWSLSGGQGSVGITRGSGGGGNANQAGGSGLILINYGGGIDPTQPTATASNSCVVTPGATLSADSTELYSPTTSTTLRWTCSNAGSYSGTSPIGTGTWSGGTPSVSTGNLPVDTSQPYTLTCYSGPLVSGVPSGTASLVQSVTVNVHSASVTLNANPARVKSGGQSVISWTLNGVSSCTVKKNGVSWAPAGANFSITSSYTQTNITQQTTYVFSCNNLGGQSIPDKPVTVNIIPVFEVF
ncbi:MAG: hypothetical protein JWN18_26 [Parcubacteria group bacterium]|nr:hypothetical protein [Parcubacteria group bacterium]